MGVQDPSACGVPPTEDQEEGFEHKSKSVSTSLERGRAERSPVVGRGGDDGTQATDAPGAPRRQREQSDPGSPEDGRGGAFRLLAQSRVNSCQERLIP